MDDVASRIADDLAELQRQQEDLQARRAAVGLVANAREHATRARVYRHAAAIARSYAEDIHA